MSPDTVYLYFPGKILLSILGATAARFARKLAGLHVHNHAAALQPMSSYEYTGSASVTMPGKHGKMSPDTVDLYSPGKIFLSILGANWPLPCLVEAGIRLISVRRVRGCAC